MIHLINFRPFTFDNCFFKKPLKLLFLTVKSVSFHSSFLFRGVYKRRMPILCLWVSNYCFAVRHVACRLVCMCESLAVSEEGIRRHVLVSPKWTRRECRCDETVGVPMKMDAVSVNPRGLCPQGYPGSFYDSCIDYSEGLGSVIVVTIVIQQTKYRTYNSGFMKINESNKRNSSPLHPSLLHLPPQRQVCFFSGEYFSSVLKQYSLKISNVYTKQVRLWIPLFTHHSAKVFFNTWPFLFLL